MRTREQSSTTGGGWAGLALVGFGVLAIWLRNRDILSDLYDYSSVIVGAGKVEAGLRPYVDFRSTMQSAGYALARLGEVVAGRNYLALTWSGLTWALGGVLALFLLWRRDFGGRLAAALAGAVGLAGLAQHVVVFYNPIGLLSLAVVVAAMPPLVRGAPLVSGRGLALLLALVVGGANKLNFQALALGLAGLIVLQAAWSGAMTWRRLAGWWLGLVAIGLGLPVALELAWTGASLEQWVYNVVLLAEERVGFITLVFSAAPYLGPTYDLHPHVFFKSLHTVGVALIVAVGVVGWRVSRSRLARAGLVLLVVAGAMGGVLLTVTNVESIALTSQGTLVAAVALAAAGGVAERKAVRRLLAGAAVMWMAVGGWAAWQGSRVLYARGDFNRAAFVRLVDAPPALAYLEGVRLDAGLHESLRLLAKELDPIVAADGDARHVLFGPTLEWLERAFPESIMPGMPVWYHVGTALRADDGPWLIGHFEAKGIDHFFTHPGWEGWPEDFQAWLDTHYRKSPVGMLRHYERRAGRAAEAASGRAAAAPLEFAAESALALLERTGSNVLLGTTRVPEPTPTFRASPWGEFFGATGGWTWRWDQPVREVEGALIAVVDGESAGLRPVEVEWRVVADPDGAREVVWSGRLTVSESQPEHRAPWRFEALGRPVELDVALRGPDAGRVAAGWRDVRIRQVGSVAAPTVPPGLIQAGETAVAREVGGVSTWKRGVLPLAGGAAGAGSCETWREAGPGGGEWKATWAIEPAPGNGGATPILMLVWAKGGRLELLQQLAPPVTAGTFTVQGWLPEADGWVGVVVRPVDAGRPLNARLELVRWSD